MGLRRQLRQLNTAQIVGAVAVVLGLLFVIAFGARVLEAYRLRNWRQRLQAEVLLLEREHADWQSEVQRRQSTAWVEEELSRMGMVRDDQVVVMVVAATPVTSATVSSEPTPSKSITGIQVADTGLFRNANWQAWRRLIRGFD
jgi:hypothetical protein